MSGLHKFIEIHQGTEGINSLATILEGNLEGYRKNFQEEFGDSVLPNHLVVFVGEDNNKQTYTLPLHISEGGGSMQFIMGGKPYKTREYRYSVPGEDENDRLFEWDVSPKGYSANNLAAFGSQLIVQRNGNDGGITFIIRDTEEVDEGILIPIEWGEEDNPTLSVRGPKAIDLFTKTTTADFEKAIDLGQKNT